MSVIVPTVTITTNDPHAYREQVERASSLAPRIHIDLMDGEFTDTKSINPVQVWWPEDTKAVDIHLMFKRPTEHLETLISLNPSLVILHAEAEGDLAAIIEHLHKFDIKVGISLLADTHVADHTDLIALVDHVLIFSGHLGHFGGNVDLSLLNKVAEIKAIKPDIEIGWDGGANETNVVQLSDGGIDVINVGGAIQRAEKPEDAYATLVATLTNR